MKQKLSILVFITVILLIPFFFLESQVEESSKIEEQKSDSVQDQVVSDKPDLTKTDQEYQVVKVVDGDTIEIEGGTRVRYIGIDTPETVDPNQKVDCYGKEASKKNKDLVEGKKVRLERDVSETDKYGRLLAYVYQGNTFVNEYLVREGYAKASTYPPDVKYQEVFTNAQKKAVAENKGLWGSCSRNVQGTAQEPIITPGNCNIKGNINSSGEKIYHIDGQKYYNQTVIDEDKGERWFCTEAEALEAGWRKSET